MFEEKTGSKLPPGVHVKVIEDDAHTVHFVIPAKPAGAAELSDTDLEAVAGGGKAGIITAIITTISDLTSIITSMPPAKKW